MVARSPRMQQREMSVVVAPPPLSPTLLRDTVKKVDKCMARLEELQHTVGGERKVMISRVSTTSVRYKQESLRIKNANPRRSPPRKLPTNAEEWRRMSLPAMLLGETMGEILQATQFARNSVEAVSSKTNRPSVDDPRTPPTERRKQKQTMEQSELHERRKKEKQVVLQTIRSESDALSAQRAKSRINFKKSPSEKRDCHDKENWRYMANRVSPRNRPWGRKTVLFPNPLFHSSSSPTSHHQKISKSPVIARNDRKIPHKFLIKSPPCASKLQVKIKSHSFCVSPTRATTASLVKKSPKASMEAKLRRSFSPSRAVKRLVSPLKSRKSVEKNGGMNTMMSGLKQRPTSTSVQF